MPNELGQFKSDRSVSDFMGDRVYAMFRYVFCIIRKTGKGPHICNVPKHSKKCFKTV